MADHHHFKMAREQKQELYDSIFEENFQDLSIKLEDGSLLSSSRIFFNIFSLYTVGGDVDHVIFPDLKHEEYCEFLDGVREGRISHDLSERHSYWINKKRFEQFCEENVTEQETNLGKQNRLLGKPDDNIAWKIISKNVSSALHFELENNSDGKKELKSYTELGADLHTHLYLQKFNLPETEIDTLPQLSETEVYNHPKFTKRDITIHSQMTETEVKSRSLVKETKINDRPLPSEMEENNRPKLTETKINNHPLLTETKINNRPLLTETKINNRPLLTETKINNRPLLTETKTNTLPPLLKEMKTRNNSTLPKQSEPAEEKVTKARKKRKLEFNPSIDCKSGEKNELILEAPFQNEKDLEVSQCALCGKILADKQSLKRHTRIVHSDVKDNHCGFCGKRFALKNYLTEHINTVHSSVKQFVCDLCGETLGSRKGMQAHKLIHQEDSKNLPCPLCPKLFRHKNVLKKHVARIHEFHPSSRLQCLQCHKYFNHAEGLKRHQKKFHGNTQEFTCDVCDARFAFNYDLNKHRKRHIVAHSKSTAKLGDVDSGLPLDPIPGLPLKSLFKNPPTTALGQVNMDPPQFSINPPPLSISLSQPNLQSKQRCISLSQPSVLSQQRSISLWQPSVQYPPPLSISLSPPSVETSQFDIHPSRTLLQHSQSNVGHPQLNEIHQSTIKNPQSDMENPHPETNASQSNLDRPQYKMNYSQPTFEESPSKMELTHSNLQPNCDPQSNMGHPNSPRDYQPTTILNHSSSDPPTFSVRVLSTTPKMRIELANSILGK